MVERAAERSAVGALNRAAYGGMFVCGVMFALLGAVLPPLSERLSFSLAGIGQLFLAMNFSMLATSLALGVAMDRYGMKLPLVAGPVLVAAALQAIAGVDSVGALFPTVVLLGMGGGALNGATNTLVADLNEDPQRKSAALNLLGVFFGFGALALPFGIGSMMAWFGVTGVLYGCAALCLAAGAYAALLRFPPPKQPARLPVAEMPRFIRMPIVAAMAMLLLFQSGNEFLLGGYFTTFLTRETGMDVPAASIALAGYWASIMAARVVLSRLLLRFDGHKVILASALGSAAGSLVVFSAGSAAAAAAGIVITGLSLSGIFPTLLGIAGAEFREHSGTVFGILFTVALTGGMLVPWVAGMLAEAAGVRWVFLMASANFAAIAVLNRCVRSIRSVS